jgi:magnesium transporter
MNTDQRPKYETDQEHMIIISKFLVYNRDLKRLETDQVSFIAGKNYLVTFQERQGKHFESVRERIRTAPVRKLIIHPDYLTYALIDSVVDNYMEIIGEIGHEIEQLEEEVLHHPGKETVNKIYRYRSELNFLRKIILPHKEIAYDLLRTDSTMIRKETIAYIRDLQDHIVLSHEIIDTYLMLVTDQLNIFNANLSNKANEIMKTLTIFASIFIPLTFVAGIYGMNFKKIPELEWDYGYLFFWGLIFLIGLGLFLFFKRRKWF